MNWQPFMNKVDSNEFELFSTLALVSVSTM